MLNYPESILKHIQQINIVRFLVLLNNDDIIGFVSFFGKSLTRKLVGLHISSSTQIFKKKGYGVELNNALFEYAFRKGGYTVIHGATSSLQKSQTKIAKEIYQHAK